MWHNGRHACPLACGGVVAPPVGVGHAPLGVGGRDKSARQIKARPRGTVLHHAHGLHTCGTGQVGQTFPLLAAGETQTVGSLRGSAVAQSAGHIDVAAAVGPRHVVEWLGQCGQCLYYELVVVARLKVIAVGQTLLAVACAAHAHHAVWHTHPHAVGSGLRQTAYFVPFHRARGVVQVKFVDVGIELLVTAVGSRCARKVAPAGH